MAKFLPEHAIKAQQWERAKGELRALVALQGSYSTGDTKPGEKDAETERWQRLYQEVEAFIDIVQSEGLQE